MKKQVKILLTLCASCLIAGCAIPKYNVTVYVSPKFIDTMKVYPSMELDVIGINVNESSRIKSIAIEDYFEYGSSLRNNLEKCTMTFSEDDIKPKLMKKNHPLWKSFATKESDQLLLIVNIPNVSEKAAKNDTRKLLIPLKTAGLFDSSDLYFELCPTGILQLKKKPKQYKIKPEDIAKKEKTKNEI